jgi:hypothetical protein
MRFLIAYNICIYAIKNKRNKIKMEITKLLKTIKPVTLANVRGKRKEASTRDKANLLKKAEEIDLILEKLGYKVLIQG